MQYPSILNHIASGMGTGIIDIRLCKDKCINDAIVGHRVPHHYKLCPNRNKLISTCMVLSLIFHREIGTSI